MHQPPSQLTTMSDPQEALKPPFVGWSKAARPIQPVGQETKSTRSSKNLTHTYYIQFISYYPILVASKSYWFCWQHPVFWQMFASYVHFVTCLDPILPWAEPVPSFLAVEPHPFFPFFSASTSFMSMAPSSNRKSLTGDGCSFFSRHGLRLFSQYGPNGSMMLKFHPCSSGYLVDILWICRICVRLKLHNAMLRHLRPSPHGESRTILRQSHIFGLGFWREKYQETIFMWYTSHGYTTWATGIEGWWRWWRLKMMLNKS